MIAVPACAVIGVIARYKASAFYRGTEPLRAFPAVAPVRLLVSSAVRSPKCATEARGGVPARVRYNGARSASPISRRAQYAVMELLTHGYARRIEVAAERLLAG